MERRTISQSIQTEYNVEEQKVLIDQWKKMFGQESGASDEAVSKFEQAAGEIAEKMS